MQIKTSFDIHTISKQTDSITADADRLTVSVNIIRVKT